ncbi:class I SAM-dependent methyltransferase (plasmid) [Nocardia sp. NBC_01377]|uniref:class I SAM-dependent methyltransferase n=1 Tax=Nocardia sp. NBC_01377 TaxID=2903595 RepID=UPI002F90A4EA
MDEQFSSGELDGSRPYSPALLRIYDPWVLGLNNHLVWRCATTNIRDQYNQHVAGDHLDIGPGTGFFLQRASYPVDVPSIMLMDLSEHPLAMTTSRLRARGITAEAVRGSVLRPFPIPEGRRFRSVAASLLMHCVPGAWDSKGRAFAHVAAVTAPEGRFFGSTVLASPSTRLSRAVGGFFNERGAFHNADDDVEGLRHALDTAWSEVEVQVIGQVALWCARGPRPPS